ncbi:hypothetical protein KUCAC02_016898 [Chaenocephalus aceratus]|nr:hypothetical protein KUCAC02_016898 [Chaenocephalus aceratus]
MASVGPAAKCLHRMKALYEVLVDGWTNPQPSPSLDAEHSTSAPTTIPSPSLDAEHSTSAPTTIPSPSLDAEHSTSAPTTIPSPSLDAEHSTSAPTTIPSPSLDAEHSQVLLPPSLTQSGRGTLHKCSYHHSLIQSRRPTLQQYLCSPAPY